MVDDRRMTSRMSRRTMAAYSVASFGCGLFYAFSNAVLPLLLKGANPLVVNLLSNTRSIEGSVIQPVVGGWSDRIWTRFGRRRPFMLVAIPLSALIMGATPLVHSLAAVAACIVVFSLLFNVAVDPYTALQGDIAPPEQRPQLNAVATVFQFVGQVALTLALSFGPFHKEIPPLVYPAVAVGILVSFIYTIVRIREPRERVVGDVRHTLSEYLRAARGQGQALRLLAALLFYNVGVNVILVNLTRFAVKVLHTSDGDAVRLFLVMVLATGLGALPAGWAAQKVGVKRVVVTGLVMIAVAALFAFAVRTDYQVIPALVLAGFGSACMTQTWPLLTLLIPAEQTGLFAGLKTSAESVSAFASSFLAFAMVGIWGYRSIFAALLLGVLFSLVILSRVRVPGQSTPVQIPYPDAA